MLSAHAVACAGASRVATPHCPSIALRELAVPAAITAFALAVVIGQRLIERKDSMASPTKAPLRLRLPSIAVLALGIVGGLLTGLLRSHIFDIFGIPADNYVGIALAVLSSFAVGPLLGSAFRTALHLPPKIVGAVSVTLLVAQTLLVQVNSPTLSAVLMSILTFAATLGFGPGPVVAATRRYKTGRLKAVWPAGVKALVEYLTAPLGTPPLTWAVPDAAYPMDGNDEDGDCTMCGVAHVIAAVNKLFKKRDHVPTQPQVLKEYFLETGGGDTGLVEANVLAKWLKVGLFGHKIAGYAPIAVQGVPLAQVILAIKQSVAFYGVCYLGILCPNSAQQQFENGQPWTNEGEKTDDGHCIVALGYTADGILCATWGGIALVTWGFLAAYLEEAWAILTHELVEAKGDTLGVDLPTLTADLVAA